MLDSGGGNLAWDRVEEREEDTIQFLEAGEDAAVTLEAAE